MEPSETIIDIYNCFTNVVNSLKVLGKYFSNLELVNKILVFLSKNWDLKVTAIQEAQDLNYFSLDELIGSLMTYEMTCIEYDEHENYLPKKMKNLTCKLIKKIWNRAYPSSNFKDDHENYMFYDRGTKC